MVLVASHRLHSGRPSCTELQCLEPPSRERQILTSALLSGCPFSFSAGLRCLSWEVLGECPCKKRCGLRAFVSGAGCLAFLMSKCVLFKETNKQSKNINSSGFYSFVLNTNKRREEKWLFLYQLFQVQVTPSLGVFGWCFCHHRTHRASSNR